MRQFIALIFLFIVSAASAVTPNIIVMLADDLGWADLSCYGSTFHESPHLDKLAGTKLDRFGDSTGALTLG